MDKSPGILFKKKKKNPGICLNDHEFEEVISLLKILNIFRQFQIVKFGFRVFKSILLQVFFCNLQIPPLPSTKLSKVFFWRAKAPFFGYDFYMDDGSK